MEQIHIWLCVSVCVGVVCRSLSVSMFTYPPLQYVLPLSAMMHSVAGVIRERHTPLESEPGW